MAAHIATKTNKGTSRLSNTDFNETLHTYRNVLYKSFIIKTSLLFLINISKIKKIKKLKIS